MEMYQSHGLETIGWYLPSSSADFFYPGIHFTSLSHPGPFFRGSMLVLKQPHMEWVPYNITGFDFH